MQCTAFLGLRSPHFHASLFSSYFQIATYQSLPRRIGKSYIDHSTGIHSVIPAFASELTVIIHFHYLDGNILLRSLALTVLTLWIQFVDYSSWSNRSVARHALVTNGRCYVSSVDVETNRSAPTRRDLSVNQGQMGFVSTSWHVVYSSLQIGIPRNYENHSLWVSNQRCV